MKIMFFPFTLLCLFCSKQPDITLEKNLLLKTDQQFAQASLDFGADSAFYMFMAEDALMFPDAADVVDGREQIFTRMKKSANNYVLSWQPQRAEVAKLADLGWTWGNYILTSQDENGVEQKSYGKYVNIWQKQIDESWKVIVDIGNSSPESQ